MVSCYLPIHPSEGQPNDIQVSVDKGANSLRTTLIGAQPESILQLEYQPCVLSLKEIKDICNYVRDNIAKQFFKAIQTDVLGKECSQYDIEF